MRIKIRGGSKSSRRGRGRGRGRGRKSIRRIIRNWKVIANYLYSEKISDKQISQFIVVT